MVLGMRQKEVIIMRKEYIGPEELLVMTDIDDGEVIMNSLTIDLPEEEIEA